MDDTFHWLETDVIGEELAAAHPSIDPLRLGFTELRRLIEALPGFRPQPGHGVNERILEEIQAAWITERGGTPREPE